MVKWLILSLGLISLFQNCGFQASLTTPFESNVVGSNTYSSDLALLDIYPKKGFNSGSQAITLQGESFTVGMRISINNQNCRSIQVISENEATCVPSQTNFTGDADVEVQRDKVIRKLPGYYKIESELRLSTISPSSGSTLGGTLVTLNGNGFDFKTFVSIGGTDCPVQQLVSANQLTCLTNANTAISSDVLIFKDWQNAKLTSAYKFFVPLSLTSSLPSFDFTTGGNDITINGNGITSAISQVTIGGLPCSNIRPFPAENKLVCNTPAHGVGEYDIIVSDPYQSSVAGTLKFKYYTQLAGEIDPKWAKTNNTTPIRIFGSGFNTNTEVSIGGILLPSNLFIVSSNGNTIDFTAPARAVGAQSVVITKKDNNAKVIDTINNLSLKYVDPLALFANPISKVNAFTNQVGNIIITFRGNGFINSETNLYIDNILAGPLSVNGTDASINLPHNNIALQRSTEKPVTFSIKTIEQNSAGINFNYIDELILNNSSPQIGFTGGDFEISIIGEGFKPNMEITLGSDLYAPGSSRTFEFVSSQLVKIIALPHNVGSYNIAAKVTSPILQSVNNLPFSYNNYSFNEVAIVEGAQAKMGTDVGNSTNARFAAPTAMASDGTYIYVADTLNSVIKRTNIQSKVTDVLAGQAMKHGYQEGVGSAALFNRPVGLVYDSGFLYVADSNNCLIRKVSTSTKQVSLVAGHFVPWTDPNSGIIYDVPTCRMAKDAANSVKTLDENGIVTSNLHRYLPGFGKLMGMAKYQNKLYVVIYPHRVVEYDLDTNTTTLVAGNGTGGVGNGNGLPGSSQLGGAQGLSVVGSTLFITQSYNHTIKKVELDPGNINNYLVLKTFSGPVNFAGNNMGYSNANGAASRFHTPTGIVSYNGSMLVADTRNCVIRAVTNDATATASLYLGIRGSCGNYDSVAGTSSKFNKPVGLLLIGDDLYISEVGNHRIRKVDLSNNMKPVSHFAGKKP